jgi:CHAD domain-containing protein
MSEPARPQLLFVPVSARQPLLDTMVSPDEALRVILFETLAQVNANVPVVMEAHCSEGLHQLRVGMRRLRTALRLTQSPTLAELDARAKVFINLVGTARDLDVFLDELFVPAVAELGSRRGFDILAARAERLRDGAWQTAEAQISSPEFRQFDEDVAAAARCVTWTHEPETIGPKTIGDMAPSVLDQALHRAKTRGRHFQELAPPKRHRLRIALKKLRYAAEFFAPLYPTKAVKRWIEPLKELQDMLGHLNDVAQVHGVLGRLLIGEAESASLQADLSHAAGLLQGFHQARSGAFAHKTHKRWKAFRATEPFWV